MSGYFPRAFIILFEIYAQTDGSQFLKQSVSDSSPTVNFVGERPLGQVRTALKPYKMRTMSRLD